MMVAARMTKDTLKIDEDGSLSEGSPDAVEVPRETMREFATGATRDTAVGKLDYEGFLSPLVLEAYATYMKFNLDTPAGLRESDNWQKGIPTDVYIKSAWRHFIDWWRIHRTLNTQDTIVWACCAVLFNVMGYLHEALKDNPHLLGEAVEEATLERDHKRELKKVPLNPSAHLDHPHKNPWAPIPMSTMQTIIQEGRHDLS